MIRFSPKNEDEEDKNQPKTPEIVKRYKQEKDQTQLSSSSHSWSRPRINMIRFVPKNEDEEDRNQPKTPEI